LGGGQPPGLTQHDAAALNMALDLISKDKESPIETTLISIGWERVEGYLRNGLALGADKAVRIWDDSFTGLSSYQKARLITAAVKLYGADLVLTGAASLDTGNGQVGPLIAGRLGLPCVGSVVELDLDKENKGLDLVKDIGRGEREKVFCILPALVTVKGEGKLPYASLDSLIESRYSEIPLLSLADLGISITELKSDPTRVTGLVQPRPRPHKAPPLDSSLPAFYRILQLLEGGITKRKGLMLEGSSEELAERLFELLKEEGVIRPAAG
jgi:electron transfer flavoprotein beta subunit